MRNRDKYESLDKAIAGIMDDYLVDTEGSMEADCRGIPTDVFAIWLDMQAGSSGQIPDNEFLGLKTENGDVAGIVGYLKSALSSVAADSRLATEIRRAIDNISSCSKG